MNVFHLFWLTETGFPCTAELISSFHWFLNVQIASLLLPCLTCFKLPAQISRSADARRLKRRGDSICCCGSQIWELLLLPVFRSLLRTKLYSLAFDYFAFTLCLATFFFKALECFGLFLSCSCANVMFPC